MLDGLKKTERMKIFELFLEKYKLKFSDIEKEIKIRSNALSYHLDAMKRQGLIEKINDYYRLTKHAETHIPLFSMSNDPGPIPIILVAIVKNNKILLLKRSKRPYKNYLSLIGGKILLHENMKDAAIRKAKEEAGIDCEFKSLNAILHERVETDKKIKHSFILFFALLEPKTRKHNKNVKWYNIHTIKENELIPTDYFLIKNNLNSRIKMHDAHMSDTENSLQLHKIGKI
ncbi:TPA: NUDIX domain-containing protein [Candidatus Woesearchaeota archaeon]|nr:NUDIX domain-containing protein [Candidatus Woesearchaeota archaeon]HIH31932.1 NUDIX domain-containing protein [Candidatus Woesearchaeota archaeon]HIH55498.1 NUDIX domain-containing protein [Candidatus Woesearchaeota archaeon]HIJ01055.1 NUDIX domain-containing protein [Candidatus Woesearchaeota archaeon]HIJ14720.1 NUDIX domain-containing protein [Candidatus Woesearchaeota archaeon]